MTKPIDAPADTAIGRWLRPLDRFLHNESASGLLLLACTVVALVLANSPIEAAFEHFWETPLHITVGRFGIGETLHFWVNDGLMTIFFFVVGLEIKREVVVGELRDPRKAALPVVAAVGGMVVPAGIYLLIERAAEGHTGWGIPMATDIAFVVGFLALLGRRVPFGLKIMLLSLAIADDLGAVLVIAVAYTHGLSFLALGLGGVGLGVIYLCSRAGVRGIPVYVVLGAAVWLAFVESGVHPTVAGVILGLMTPVYPWLRDEAAIRLLGDALAHLQTHPVRDGPARRATLGRLADTAREAVSPLERLEITLHPWVVFGVMPVFALANAGVPIRPASLDSPVAHAVAAGLVFGKPIGIVAFSWLAVRLGLARLPTGVNWRALLGAGCLGGIGFTMSLFIAQLALRGELLDAGKVGTLAGSLISAVVGLILLVCFLPAPPAAKAEVT
jgi:NhaA family Na+:H+ antiporter